MGSLGLRSRDVYPFTVYHASAKSARRYTLYANSLAIRTAWKNALDEAIALRTYRQDANMVSRLLKCLIRHLSSH